MKNMLLLAVSLCLAWHLTGCSEKSNPLPSRSHPKDWNVATAQNFHGTKVLESDKGYCTGCHGFDLTGGTAGVACGDCHTLYPHNSEWIAMNSDLFHGRYIAEAGWSMQECQKCHGQDYRSGGERMACTTCHEDEAGPEACRTCHGNRNNPAPPEDLQGNTSTAAIGVGAHQRHVAALKSCAPCHNTYTALNDPEHIDSLPRAEVKAGIGWNRESGRCTTACHPASGPAYVWNRP